jgi:hypothetical protein
MSGNRIHPRRVDPLTTQARTSSLLISSYGGDLASTGSVKPWLRAQVPSPGKTLGKITTANSNLALAA